MSYATLQELKDSLQIVAASRGLTAADPVVLVYDNADTNFKSVRIIVSYAEPYQIVAPLNVLWLVADPASPNYFKLFRRSARAPSATYNHTWSEVTQITNVWQLQIWDVSQPSNVDLLDHTLTVGNPHNSTAKDVGAIGVEGGTLTGPLNVRTLGESPDDYADEEAVPRSFMESALDVIRAVNSSIQQAFTNIFAQIDNLRGRVEILELSLLGLKGHIFDQETPITIWNIQHDMNNTNIMVSVYEGGTMVLPQNITIIDANNVQIVFAAPVAGKAEIVPIVEFA